MLLKDYFFTGLKAESLREQLKKCLPAAVTGPALILIIKMVATRFCGQPYLV